MYSKLLGGACAAVLLAGCAGLNLSPNTSSSATLGEWGVELNQVSTAVAPGDDFNAFVNEGWLNSNEPRQGYSSAGGFLDLHLESQAQVQAIIEDASTSQNRNRAEQQIGDMYASYTDRERIEALGLEPIQAELDATLALESHEDVARTFARPFHASPVGIFISPDFGDPTRYVTWLFQSGLNLPNKTYYFDEDERFQGYREAYVNYVEETFERAGIDRARERAEAVMALETAIADAHWEREETRDRVRNYDLQTREALEEYAPEFAWGVFFEELGLENEADFIVNTNTAVQAIAQIFRDTPVDVWSSYLAFNYIDAHAAQLPQEYVDANWRFYRNTLSGIEEQRTLETRAVSFTSGNLGEVIGQVYVDRYFPESSKDQMDELVQYLILAYEDRIRGLEWMDEETRIEALDKLDGFTPKIGYPSQWRDYSSIEIVPGDVIGNSHRIAEWSWADSRSRLGGPIRRWEWGMSPQTVNAYYASNRNEIVFPAAILQAPFFDPQADMAVNFGAIGGVIGHEIGHGFDDQGSRTDRIGSLRDWWTDGSREAFEERTGALVEQYNEFSPLEGYNVNGAVTLGENIGDLGGLSIALVAYHMWLADNGGEAPVLDGFTGDQRVFMGWAQAFRAVRTDDSMVARVESGVHSPAMFRINGVVRNIDNWYDAFGVSEDDALYLPPEERVKIW